MTTIRRGVTRSLDQPQDPYRGLMAGIVKQAVLDLADQDALTLRRVEVFCWLSTDEAKVLIDVLELPNPFQHFTKIRKIRRPYNRPRSKND